MEFKLTSEQKEEILLSYDVNKKDIRVIEAGLNASGMVQDEEDYFDLVSSVAFRYQTVKFICSNIKNIEDKAKEYIKIPEIIAQELELKYINYSFDNQTQTGFEKYLTDNKKRHN